MLLDEWVFYLGIMEFSLLLFRVEGEYFALREVLMFLMKFDRLVVFFVELVKGV